MFALMHFYDYTSKVGLLDNAKPRFLTKTQSQAYPLTEFRGYWMWTRVGFSMQFSAFYTDGTTVFFQLGDQVFDLAAYTFHKSHHLLRPRFWITNKDGEIVLDIRYWYGSMIVIGIYIDFVGPEYDAYDLLSWVITLNHKPDAREYVRSLKWLRNIEKVFGDG